MSNKQKANATRRVIKYLTDHNDRGLTAAQANAMFGVANLPATMTRVRKIVERYGNWEVNRETNSRGAARYHLDRV